MLSTGLGDDALLAALRCCAQPDLVEERVGAPGEEHPSRHHPSRHSAACGGPGSLTTAECSLRRCV